MIRPTDRPTGARRPQAAAAKQLSFRLIKHGTLPPSTIILRLNYWERALCSFFSSSSSLHGYSRRNRYTSFMDGGGGAQIDPGGVGEREKIPSPGWQYYIGSTAARLCTKRRWWCTRHKGTGAGLAQLGPVPPSHLKRIWLPYIDIAYSILLSASPDVDNMSL